MDYAEKNTAFKSFISLKLWNATYLFPLIRNFQNLWIYLYFSSQVSCWTQGISYFTVKSILCVCTDGFKLPYHTWILKVFGCHKSFLYSRSLKIRFSVSVEEIYNFNNDMKTNLSVRFCTYIILHSQAQASKWCYKKENIYLKCFLLSEKENWVVSLVTLCEVFCSHRDAREVNDWGSEQLKCKL